MGDDPITFALATQRSTVELHPQNLAPGRGIGPLCGVPKAPVLPLNEPGSNFGWLSGNRTPVRCSRGNRPTTERRANFKNDTGAGALLHIRDLLELRPHSSSGGHPRIVGATKSHCPSNRGLQKRPCTSHIQLWLHRRDSNPHLQS